MIVISDLNRAYFSIYYMSCFYNAVVMVVVCVCVCARGVTGSGDCIILQVTVVNNCFDHILLVTPF